MGRGALHGKTGKKYKMTRFTVRSIFRVPVMYSRTGYRESARLIQ
jgi:hypothetical protein